MKPYQVQARARHQCRQPLHEFHRREDDVGIILPAAEEGLAALGWTQDAQAVTGGHILQLSHGSTRLSRQNGNGATSSLILRRAD